MYCTECPTVSALGEVMWHVKFEIVELGIYALGRGNAGSGYQGGVRAWRRKGKGGWV
jgi:hypothetical protein